MLCMFSGLSFRLLCRCTARAACRRQESFDLKFQWEAGCSPSVVAIVPSSKNVLVLHKSQILPPPRMLLSRW